MERIKSVTIITTQGIMAYRVDDKIGLDNAVIDNIIIDDIYINGDPYEHYIIYDTDDDIRVTINRIAPCEVVYFKD